MTAVELAREAIVACAALRDAFDAYRRNSESGGWSALAHAERLWLDLERDARTILEHHEKWGQEG